ncbi:MAG TPA: (d)CMP kinase [Spirochaetota bacterium]|nr:(d)CMP kinase [Spirochaetota bacterium]HPH01778.1 (d)CMP kinase [Spirochaetota bacterium]
MRTKPIIAIDGPAGAGKSTIARKIAAALNFVYIDTGAMYRALTLRLLRSRTDPADLAGVRSILETVRIGFDPSGKIFLDGEDVSGTLRTAEVNSMVSTVAGLPAVRESMQKLQRETGSEGGVVLDGRDIGSAVFPDAEYKFYLDASLEERARRRMNDSKEKVFADLEAIQQDIARRDAADSQREHSPLVRAEDAQYIDTTGMGPEMVVSAMLEYIDRRSVR